MIRGPGRRVSRAGWCLCAGVALAACGPARRDPNGPLAEPTAAEQTHALARVAWQELYARGVALADQGDAARAEQYLAAAIQRGGPTEQILPRLMRVCVDAQRFRAALQYARPFLETHPDAWALRYLVATIDAGVGEPRLAREQLEIVLRSRPDNAEVEYTLACLLRDELSDPGAADAHFRRYLALAPDGAHAAEARAGLFTPVVHAQ